MKFLIVGRTATGKDALASILCHKYNWSFVKSMTTRPRRYEKEDTHVFISQEEADKIPYDDRVAYTNINGYDYFATRNQVEESDAYIIDPKGVDVLLKKMPEEKFIIVYLIPKDKVTQRTKAVSRVKDVKDKIQEFAIFDSRYESEDAQFTDFENTLDDYTIYKNKNVIDFVRFINTYDIDSLEHFAHNLNLIKKIGNI